MALTSAEYANAGGVLCPVCENDQLEGDSVEIEAGSASQRVTCLECQAYWYDVYVLTGFVELVKEQQ